MNYHFFKIKKVPFTISLDMKIYRLAKINLQSPRGEPRIAQSPLVTLFEKEDLPFHDYVDKGRHFR